MARTASFIVTVDLPPKVSRADMRAYIEGEVKAGCGQYHPTDPIFSLDRDSVKVRHAPKEAKPS